MIMEVILEKANRVLWILQLNEGGVRLMDWTIHKGLCFINFCSEKNEKLIFNL